MSGILKYLLFFYLIMIVVTDAPFDPCTNVVNPTSISSCNTTTTIYNNSICCFLSSTKNGQTFNACFPSYYGSSRTYSSNGISANFYCSGYFQSISFFMISAYLINFILF